MTPGSGKDGMCHWKEGDSCEWGGGEGLEEDSSGTMCTGHVGRHQARSLLLSQIQNFGDRKRCLQMIFRNPLNLSRRRTHREDTHYCSGRGADVSLWTTGGWGQAPGPPGCVQLCRRCWACAVWEEWQFGSEGSHVTHQVLSQTFSLSGVEMSREDFRGDRQGERMVCVFSILIFWNVPPYKHSVCAGNTQTESLTTCPRG